MSSWLKRWCDGLCIEMLSTPLLKSRWVGLWLAVSVLAGAVAIFFGPDEEGNTTFWQRTNGPYGGAVHSFAINSSGHIFAGTINGIYRSTDNRDSWTRILFVNSAVHSLAINSERDIFAGTYGGGVFRSVESTTGHN